MKETLEHQLSKIYSKNTSDKNSSIRATWNISIFCYLIHKICEYVSSLVFTNLIGVNASTFLSKL